MWYEESEEECGGDGCERRDRGQIVQGCLQNEYSHFEQWKIMKDFLKGNGHAFIFKEKINY